MVGGTLTLNDGNDSLVFDATIDGVIGTIENSGSITFNVPATFGNGVDFNMIGGDARLVVNSEVNIDVGDFNLDGNGGIGNAPRSTPAASSISISASAPTTSSTYDQSQRRRARRHSTTTTTGASINRHNQRRGRRDSTINGETFQVADTGGIHVAAGATLNVNAVTQITGATGFTIAAGAVLDFGTVTYGPAGAHSQATVMLRKGTATIAAPTTWNVAVVKSRRWLNDAQ